MSAVTEFEPVFDIPERARRSASEWDVDRCDNRPLAAVVQLHRPSEGAVAAPIRLTRRGVVVLSLGVGLLCLALLGLARLSAPAAAGGSAASVVPAHVSVLSGDTLWSIAERIAPQTDPRAEVAKLQQLNHLGSASLEPGQLIRAR